MLHSPRLVWSGACQFDMQCSSFLHCNYTKTESQKVNVNRVMQDSIHDTTGSEPTHSADGMNLTQI